MQSSGSPKRIATDPDAFDAFYRETIDKVTGFVARRVEDPELVADLVTETYLAAIDSAERYRPELGTPQGWIYGITRNVLGDEIRRRTRESRALRRMAGHRPLESDALSRLEERIDAERDSREVLRVLQSLTPRDRQLFELTALDGLTNAEAGQVLGLSAGAVGIRLHRSRERVNQLLQARKTTTAQMKEATQ